MREPANRVKLPFRVSSQRLSLVLTLTLASLLLIGRAESYLVDRVRQAMTDLSAPLLEIASRPVAAARNLIARTDEYAYVFEENARLRAQNEKLLAWREEALKLDRKVSRLEALLGVTVDPSISYATGRVIGDSGGPFVHAFIVNVSASEGAKPGQAVVDDKGLVGRVVSAGVNASRVLLLTDLNSRIPVRIEPSGYRAIAVGDNSGRPKLDFLPPEAVLTAGDRVITSGHGGLMPPDIPVGAVAVGKAGEPRLRPYSDFDRSSVVRVLQYEFPTRVLPEPDAVEDGEADGNEAKPEAAADPVVAEQQAPPRPEPRPVRSGTPSAAAGTESAQAAEGQAPDGSPLETFDE